MTGDADGHPWSVWPAPAKLNLFLRITGRRADGYHTLQTVFRLLDWGDQIRLRVRDDGRVVRHGCIGQELTEQVIAEKNDLAVRAAILLQKVGNVAHGIDIVVEKRIPLGGGFGGGSSDAATVLVAANALWSCGYSVDRLAALGAGLGADVAVFVHGRNAWAEGVGERLTPLDLPAAWYVLVDPGVHAPTADLFQASELTRNAAPVTIADFVSGLSAQGQPLGNAFESISRHREPAVEATFRVLARIGSPHLTGSGSGCFVEFSDRQSAETGLATLSRGLKAWVAEGAARSPLLDALEIYRA